ncbi:MAG: 23S rRNA (cytosine1962-C5)-methyltransferase [Verrucomicrobiales bacterium]|jgi:23S rRNA (cytosine1962-C5)-methyltransferase
MQQSAFDQLLSKAVAWRATIPSVSSGATNAFRVLDGDGDGVPGLYIDNYAGHWLVQTRDVPFPESLRNLLPDSCLAVWWKALTNANTERDAPQWMAGSQESAVVAKENGVKYAIDFASGYSQGIFLDQRDKRQWLQLECSPGDRVLNLFAYTCAFSVAAGLSQAHTTSVDLSSNYLDWGRRNFALNGIDCEQAGHRFFNWDTFEFLKMAQRKKESYAFIVCDPPTFSRNKSGKVFRVEKDYATLVSQCASVLTPGGKLLCSTNHRGFSRRKLEESVHYGVTQADRDVKSLKANQMPADFTGDAYLKSLLVTVGP